MGRDAKLEMLDIEEEVLAGVLGLQLARKSLSYMDDPSMLFIPIRQVPKLGHLQKGHINSVYTPKSWPSIRILGTFDKGMIRQNVTNDTVHVQNMFLLLLVLRCEYSVLTVISRVSHA